jgi:hypothetical protein
MPPPSCICALDSSISDTADQQKRDSPKVLLARGRVDQAVLLRSAVHGLRQFPRPFTSLHRNIPTPSKLIENSIRHEADLPRRREKSEAPGTRDQTSDHQHRVTILNGSIESVRDIVLVKPSMQFRPCILKDLACSRKPLRVGTDREILHERL